MKVALPFCVAALLVILNFQLVFGVTYRTSPSRRRYTATRYVEPTRRRVTARVVASPRRSSYYPSSRRTSSSSYRRYYTTSSSTSGRRRTYYPSTSRRRPSTARQVYSVPTRRVTYPAQTRRSAPISSSRQYIIRRYHTMPARVMSRPNPALFPDASKEFREVFDASRPQQRQTYTELVTPKPVYPQQRSSHKSTAVDSVYARLRCSWVGALKSSPLLLLTEAMNRYDTSGYAIKSVTKQSVDTTGHCTTTCVYSSKVKISFSLAPGSGGCSWKDQGCSCSAMRGSTALNCEASGVLQRKDDKTFDDLDVTCQQFAIRLLPEAAAVTVKPEIDVTTATTSAPPVAVTTTTTTAVATTTTPVATTTTMVATEPTPSLDALDIGGSGEEGSGQDSDVIVRPAPIISSQSEASKAVEIDNKLEDDELIPIY